MNFLALATDYDGTIADHGVVDAATLAALQRAKAGGLKLILVTGRELQGMFDVFEHWRIFDWMVVENGALIYEPATGRSELVAAPPPPELAERLRARGVPISAGRSIVSTYMPHHHAALDVIRELGLEWQIIFNNTAVMLLPSGVNKATGLRAAAKQLGIDTQQIVAVGDAENDLAFLAAAGLGVAVANAIPSVKAAAGRVMTKPVGAGVAELIDQLLEESRR